MEISIVDGPQKAKSVSATVFSYTTLGYVSLTLAIPANPCSLLLIHNNKELTGETMKYKVGTSMTQ